MENVGSQLTVGVKNDSTPLYTAGAAVAAIHILKSGWLLITSSRLLSQVHTMNNTFPSHSTYIIPTHSPPPSRWLHFILKST